MKKIIIAAIATLFAANAFAQTNEATVRAFDQDPSLLARVAISLDSQAEGQEWGIVTLREGGRISMERFLYNWGSIRPKFLGYADIQVAPRLEKNLLNSLKTLSNVELEETHSEIVCMMMPPPGPSRGLVVRRNWDWQTETFTGEPKMIMDNTGCWSPYHVQPANQWGVREAVRFQTMLETLALQATL